MNNNTYSNEEKALLLKILAARKKRVENLLKLYEMGATSAFMVSASPFFQQEATLMNHFMQELEKSGIGKEGVLPSLT